VIGRTISHFRVTSQLGAGAMGEVYAAEDTRLGRQVALKIVSREIAAADDHQQLLREAQVAASLNHPGICTVHEVGEADDGGLFIAMELVEGPTLAEVVAEGPLSPQRACALLERLASAMEHAHDRGVIHRDLKPSNIMLTADGEPKIMDFGLALKRSAEGSLELEDFGGTRSYLAPEQIQGDDPDELTDIWALGVVFYELLTGRRPFVGDYTAALLYAIAHVDPPPVVETNPRAEPLQTTLVDRLLARDRDHRCASMTEVREILREVGPGAVKRPGNRRRLAVLAAAGLLVVAGAWFGGHALRGPSGSRASVAIMPLHTTSAETAVQEFAVGFSGEVISSLASVADLRVIAQSSSRLLAAENLPPAEIARRLGVDAVMGGTIREVGGSLRVSAELVDAHDDRVLWAESFDTMPENALILQASVARAVATTLKGKLSEREEEVLTSTEQIDPQAHRAYLKGVALLDTWGNDEIWYRAIEQLRTATTLEPTFAPAWAALADVYHFLRWFDDSPEKNYLAMNRAAIARALELDPDLPAALVQKAKTAYLFDQDWNGAEALYRRALELAPGDAQVHNDYAAYLYLADRCGEAERHAWRSVELSPLPFNNKREYALTLINCRRFEACVVYLDEIEDLHRDDVYVWVFRSWALGYLGRFDEAVTMADSARARGGGPICSAVYWAAGQKDLAWELIGGRDGADPEVAMFLNMLEGEHDGVLDMLEYLAEHFPPRCIYHLIDPLYDPIRAEPRFIALVEKMKMPGLR
jgi:TolB-like protein/predicted Ser/Thr protein kinase